MDELIEAVARAIAEADGYVYGEPEDGYYNSVARAAIAAVQDYAAIVPKVATVNMCRAFGQTKDLGATACYETMLAVSSYSPEEPAL